MSNACNTATVLLPEYFSGAEAPAALCTVSAQIPGAEQSISANVAACVHAAAVLEVVEGLALDRGDEAAAQARNAATWALRRRHDRYWSSRLAANAEGRSQAQHLPMPARTFGASLLATPCGLEPGPDGNLWVASFASERLCVFSPQGEPLRQVPLPGVRPFGLFAGAAGALWVCDLSRPRLLEITPDGAPGCSLTLESGDLRPLRGVAHGNEMYLILVNAQCQTRLLARLDLGQAVHNGAEAHVGVELLPCPIRNLSGVELRDGHLYASGQNPPVLLRRPLHGGEWSSASQAMLPEYLTQFGFHGAETWLAARHHLARLGANGGLDIVMDAGSQSGYSGCNFCDLAFLKGQDSDAIYLTDNINDVIHHFEIKQSPPAS